MKTWVKILGVISIILIVLVIISMIFVALTGDAFATGFTFLLIFFPILAMVIGAWLIGFLLAYLKNKIIANIISVAGLVFFSIIFLISILGLFQIMPFKRWDIAGWFAWPFQLAIIIFFIVSTIVINKK